MKKYLINKQDTYRVTIDLQDKLLSVSTGKYKYESRVYKDAEVLYITNESPYEKYRQEIVKLANDVTNFNAIKAATNVRHKVFMSPLATTPRELIRKDFDITRDMNKAEVVVVPGSINSNWGSTTYNASAVLELTNRKTGEDYNIIYRIYVNKVRPNGTIIYTTHDEDIQWINAHKDELKGSIIRHEVTTDYALKDFTYHICESSYMVKNDKAVIDLIEGNKLAGKYYIPENSFDVSTSNNFSPEMLFTLFNCTDKTIVEKTLLASDWKEYPFTCYMLIGAITRKLNTRIGGSRAFRSLTEQIRATDWHNVSAKDYNMYQEFCMKALGIQGQALITTDKFNEMNKYNIGTYMHHMIAIKYAPATDTVNIYRLR